MEHCFSNFQSGLFVEISKSAIKIKIVIVKKKAVLIYWLKSNGRAIEISNISKKGNGFAVAFLYVSECSNDVKY